MAEKILDLLRRDECQPLTQAQIADIKAQTATRPKANVNIKPYEIYSPNEQVVGEWQEEISGVLKKKPVYEKTYTGTTGNISDNSKSTVTVDSQFTGKQLIYTNVYVNWGGGNVTGTIMISSYAPLGTNNGGRIFVDGSNLNLELVGSHMSNQQYGVTIQYTKTTDSWEVV